MSQLKYFNPNTQEWEVVVLGGQGPQGEKGETGETGVVAATTPLSYDSNTQTVSISVGTGSDQVAAGNHTHSQSQITNLSSDLALKAPLASPALTGNASVDNLTINGSLTFNGTATTINSTNLEVTDSMIYLAYNQYDTDTVDTGILAAYGDSNAGHFHTGIIRDATDGKWKLISNAGEPSSNVMDFSGVTYDTLKLGSVEATSATIGNVSNTELQYLDGVTSAIQTQIDGKSFTSHLHDDRYYTESEVDTLLNNKASTSGTTFTASSSTSTPLKVKGATSQSVDLQQWLDSSGTTKTKINSAGKLYIETASDFATVGENNGVGGIEIKSTSSTAASMSFHVPNVLATNMGIDATNSKFSIGGWSIPSGSLTIDGSGRVSTPNQPSVHASSSTKNSSGIFTNYSTSDGGIGFRYRNVGGHLNTTSGRFTAPITGRYLITALYISSSGVVERNIAWLYINGTNIGEWTEAYGQYDDQSAASVFYLNANDYVEIATHTGIPFDGVVSTIDFLG